MDTKIEKIAEKAIAIPGNDLDTDRITPARFLKEITFEKMGHYLFYDVRFDAQGNPKGHPLNDLTFKDAKIMLVNKNFGCGSSREHAPQSIKRYGFKAIIGESFSEIFSGNCKAIGLPVLIVTESEIATLQAECQSNPSALFTINIQNLTLTTPTQTLRFKMPSGHQEAFLSGEWDVITSLEKNKDKISAVNAALPY